MCGYNPGEENKVKNDIKDRLSKIKNKIVVMSGKGGVGKSTVAANIAMSLALKGYKTGLLDVDIHGPSIPTIFGLENQRIQITENEMLPLGFGDNLKIISIGFLIDNADSAIIWRGPAKAGVIKQFINDVDWGELDYLIVDCPPGTGDEPLSVIQLLEDVTGAVIVTTPQKLAIADVRKSVNFCEKVDVAVLGVIENMSGFVCPDCNKTVEIFKSGGGEKMAKDMNVPFLGKIPLDPNIVDAGDSGKPFLYFYSETPTAKIMEEIIRPITEDTLIKKK
jgi:Mrp family chromosome partitioning ATPase